VKFDFSEEKNNLLFEERGVTFYRAIESIAENGILLNFEHPNQEKYPGQKILIIEIDGYAYCIPYIVNGDTWFLKTIYPSRKFNYLLKTEDPNGQV
jgi:hypothetical protein